MMGKKSFTITSKEACLRCAALGRESEACVAVKEEVQGVVVHSAWCEEHFTVVQPPTAKRHVKRPWFFGLF